MESFRLEETLKMMESNCSPNFCKAAARSTAGERSKGKFQGKTLLQISERQNKLRMSGIFLPAAMPIWG